MTNNKMVILNSNNFEDEVVNSDIPVLIDFWAAWCAPCKMIAPILGQLADDFEGKLKIAKVNVDEEAELASNFRIMSIPTLLLFKGGQMVDQMIGVRPRAELVKFVQKAL